MTRAELEEGVATPSPRKVIQYAKDPVLNQILNETTPDLKQRERYDGFSRLSGWIQPRSASRSRLLWGRRNDARGRDARIRPWYAKYAHSAPAGQPPAPISENHVPLAAIPEGISALDVARAGIVPPAVTEALTNYDRMKQILTQSKVSSNHQDGGCGARTVFARFDRGARRARRLCAGHQRRRRSRPRRPNDRGDDGEPGGATAARFLAVPAVVGVMQPSGGGGAGVSAPPSGVTDDFSRRRAGQRADRRSALGAASAADAAGSRQQSLALVLRPLQRRARLRAAHPHQPHRLRRRERRDVAALRPGWKGRPRRDGLLAALGLRQRLMTSKRSAKPPTTSARRSTSASRSARTARPATSRA